MAKDPATLWYWNDWNGGTGTFTRHLKGCYMDLLSAQFNNGHLSLEEVKTVLGSDFGSSWPTIQKKFKQDPQGLFFNERADLEKKKRSEYTESRRNNLKGTHKEPQVKPHMDTHMENENRNENAIENLNENGGAGGFEQKFVIAFDDQTCERFAMTFKGYDLAAELQRFRTKCDNDPANYHPRDAAGLRAAFQYQLNTKPNGSSTKQKPIDKLAEAARIIEGRNGSL